MHRKMNMLKFFLSVPAVLVIFVCNTSHSQVAPNSNPNCLSGSSAWYRGTLNYTKSGIPCQRWDSNTPHKIFFRPSDRIDHNYCRNPDFHVHGLWCYTTNPTKKWENCDLPKCPDDSMIFYTSRNRRGVSWIGKFPADPETGLTNRKLHDTIYNASIHNPIWSLVSDKAGKRILFTESTTNRLVSLHLDTNETSTHMEGMAHGIEGMAYDWINKNLYITDAKRNVIKVTNDKFQFFASIYRHRDEKPFGIAVHSPSRKVFFTTRHFTRNAIKSCDLDGKNLKDVIRSPDIRSVPSLTVDYTDEGLYWINIQRYGAGTSIMRCNIDGTNITTLHKISANSRKIATYLDSIFLADINLYKDNHKGTFYRLWVVPKRGGYKESYVFKTKVESLSVYSKNEEYAPADVLRSSNTCFPNNPCQQLCVESSDQTPSCLCSYGFKNVGNNRCERNFLQDKFMITCDFVMKKLFQIPLDLSAADEYSILLTEEKFERNVKSLALDSNLKILYWYDSNTSTIYKSNLNGSNGVAFLRGVHASNLAVDSQTGNLYFFDDDFDYLYVVSKRGDFPKVLLTPRDVPSNYTRLQSMAIDQANKFIYWSATAEEFIPAHYGDYEYDTPPPLGEVRRMGLDGSNKQVVLHNMPLPTALTISNERNSLFVANDGDKVYEVPLDGIATSTGSLPSETKTYRNYRASHVEPIESIQVSGRYMYLNVFGEGRIQRYNLINTDQPDIDFGSTDFYGLKFMVIYDSEYQQTFASPLTAECDELNCSHLCLQTPKKRVRCACGNSYRFRKQSINICIHDSDDDTPPIYDFCPESRSIDVQFCGLPIQLPGWREPAWTDDNTPLNKMTYSMPRVSTTYTAGVYYFRYTATDLSGNVGRCSFAIAIRHVNCSTLPSYDSSILAVSKLMCLNGDIVQQIWCKDKSKQIQYGKLNNKTLWNICQPDLQWIIQDYNQFSCEAVATTSTRTASSSSTTPTTTTTSISTDKTRTSNKIVTPLHETSTITTTSATKSPQASPRTVSIKKPTSSSKIFTTLYEIPLTTNESAHALNASREAVMKQANQQPSHGGLSSGSVAAIVVVVLLTIITAIVIAILYAKKKRLLPVVTLSNPVSMLWKKSSDDLTKNEVSNYHPF